MAFCGIGASAALAAPPTVTLDPITVHSITTAHATGEVSVDSEANGGFETYWCFESTPEGQEAWSQGTCGGPVAPAAGEAIAGDFTGLNAGQAYEVRISYLNFNDSVTEFSAVQSFETDPAPVVPTFVLGPPEAVSYTSAHISATFNPEGGNEDAVAGPIPIAAQLEINREGQGWNPVGGSLTIEGSDAVSSEDFELEADPTELAPGAEYEFRVLAHYAGREAQSTPAGEFTTLAVAKPTISNFAISALTAESAHFSAEVDPGGTDPAFDAHWHFECTPSCSGLESGTVSGAAETVESDATQLEPNTFYTVRLFASNAGGTTKETETLQTGGSAPFVNSFAAGPVGPTSAGINAAINPRGSSTVYWFEWGIEDCSVPGASCTSIPATHDASAGAGNLFHYFSRTLTGLTPGATYHFRVIAESDQGTTAGDDQTFTTAAAEAAECPNEARRAEMHSTFLPDCRAYEMVSPSEKNGQDVISQTTKTHVAADGNGVTFATIGGFGSQQGTSFDSEYLARRTAQADTNGWTTQGINPRNRSNTFGSQSSSGAGPNNPSFMDAFTPDLSAAIYRSWRPLTDGSNTSEVTNFYRVDGLGDPGAAVHLLSDSVDPLPAAWSAPFYNFIFQLFIGASTDLGHVAFESPLALTADAPPYEGACASIAPLPEFFGCPTHLYENADGVVRLVGRIPSAPDTECDDVDGPSCVAAPSSQAGIGARERRYSGRMVSADGSRIFFQAPTGGQESGNIYLREDGERTYQLNVSESEPSAEPQPAELWEASRDGSRVFFITSASLLAEDEDPDPDLYMYEVEKPAGQRLTLVSASSVNDGRVTVVIGASDDGRYVYFVASGQLVSGEPPVNLTGLYMWHDGDLSYLGRFRDATEAQLNGPRISWAFISEAKVSRLTPDGRHLLFMTQEDVGLQGRGGFAGYDHQGHQELYLYSADSGRLECVWCNPDGTPATADALTNVREGAAYSASTSDQSHALSDDGRYVFFTTAEPLLEGDTNGQPDAYEYDSRTGQVHLLSSGTDPFPSYLIDASNDGRDAFFVTRERLSGWDTDDANDLYDARAGGGLPEPRPVPAACEGESCLPGAAAPPTAAPTTSQAAGSGNPKQRCPKGRREVRRHGTTRCVKAKKHHKRANPNRRASR